MSSISATKNQIIWLSKQYSSPIFCDHALFSEFAQISPGSSQWISLSHTISFSLSLSMFEAAAARIPWYIAYKLVGVSLLELA